MPKPGLGQRLVARIKAKGYADPDSKFGIKVTEFALDHRYPPGSVFKWIGDVVVPDYETILRLARDLDTAPGWLHYGDELPQKPRRPATARRRDVVEKPQPAVASSVLKEKHTKRSVSARKDDRGEALWKVRGRTGARRLLHPVPAAAHGVRRLAA